MTGRRLRYKSLMVKIAPSILSADFAALADDVARVEAGGADLLHVDVMDGRFVPNLTIGPVVVEALRKRTRLPLDVHLMMVEPERYVADFVRAGADMVTVHVEACPHLQRNLAQIRDLGDRPVELAVDGGVKVEHVRRLVEHGATVLVAGSAIFGQADPASVIAAMRSAAP